MTSSKSKKAKQRQRRRHKRRQKPLEGLKRKLEQGPLQGQEFVIEPSGEVKMSEVLMAFVEPYIESANTEEAHRKLLMLAIVAWNAALLPEEDQQDIVDKAVKAIPAASWAMRAYMKSFMSELIERKKTYFSEYTRMMLDFELTDMGEGYHLSVASTLEKPPSP